MFSQLIESIKQLTRARCFFLQATVLFQSNVVRKTTKLFPKQIFKQNKLKKGWKSRKLAAIEVNFIIFRIKFSAK